MLIPAKLKRVEIKGMRFYETPELNYYPSITTILNNTISDEKEKSLAKWQNSLGIKEAKEFTNNAAKKGTNVHTLIERYLKKEELKLKDFTNEEANNFTALKMKLNAISDIQGLELSLYSDLLEVAGTCDCVASYNKVPSIIDFKTSVRLKTDKEISDYKLQCTAYGIAVNEKFGTDIDQGVILMTAQTGFPLEWKFNLTEQLPELLKRIDIFYSRLNSKLN